MSKEAYDKITDELLAALEFGAKKPGSEICKLDRSTLLSIVAEVRRLRAKLDEAALNG